MRLVRFVYCDNGGVIRGKVVPVDQLANRMRTGVGITTAMLAMNSLDQLQPVEGMGPVGEIRLVPDPATFTVLPYAPRTARDGRRPRRLGRSTVRSRAPALPRSDDDQPWPNGAWSCAPRSRTSSRSLAIEDGRYVPIDTSLCFSTIGMTAAADVIDAIVDALDAPGDPDRAVLPRARARSA